VPDRKHLLIPIHVDALVVGGDEDDSQSSPLKNGTVSAALNYSRLKDFNLIGSELREWEAPLDPALEPGVHLHFRLPAAAAHGDLDKKPAFPKIPNRWLVQRYYKPKRGDKLNTRAWLVYSDQRATENEDAESAVELLVAPAGGTSAHGRYDTRFSFCPTGVVKPIWPPEDADGGYDISKDNEEGAVEDLTAVTGGDAGFSAHYPACRGILGFHDDLEDVDPDPKLKLSYLITGWYSRSEDDPWSNLMAELAKEEDADKKRKKLNDWMQQRGCVKDFGDKALPAGIVCHGAVKGVCRNKDGSAAKNVSGDPFENFEKLKHYWVDLGSTSAEAFAARVAKQRTNGEKSKDPADVNLLEDLVTALQIGLFSQGSNVAEMDAELHRQGFAAVSGGKAWAIHQAVPQPDEVPLAPPKAFPPVPQDLQKQLDELNDLQQACDRHGRLLRDYRWELYALWHRLNDPAAKPELRNKLKPNLDRLKEFVRKYTEFYESDEGGLLAKRNGAKVDLGKKLEARSDAAVEYSLTEQPAALFYVPKDPEILITGAAAEARGTQPRPDSVLVRVTGEELKTFGASDPLQTLGVSQEYLDAIPPWSARLFKEALLLDEFEIAHPRAEHTRETRETKAEPGVLPDDFSHFHWDHNPWIPLYLGWEVAWQAEAARDQIASNVITEHWILEDRGEELTSSTYRRHTDLIHSKPAVVQKEEVKCRGLCFVGRPLFNLRYARAETGTSLRELTDAINKSLGSRPSMMISQALGGLHDALIMRREGDQLPPLDYVRWAGKGHPLYLDRIGQILGDNFHPDSSPARPSSALPFSPLRTGLLQLKNLWIIDVFGQRTEVWPEGLPAEAPGVCQSGRLVVEPDSSDKPRKKAVAVRLPPRFCRPMRLEFAAISAEAPGDEGGSVCGWVVPNRFDQNLVLYAAKGRPVGILQKRFETGHQEETLFYWVAVPGARGVDENVAGIQNPHLKAFAKFVLSLDSDAGDQFDRLINKAVEATEQRTPEDNPVLSVLIGRPLALVRAELRLEMDGLPALDQIRSWVDEPELGEPSLDQILNGSLETGTRPPSNRFMNTGGVEKVRWPLRLGDRRSSNDGLVGFFKGKPPEPGKKAYPLKQHPFYASWGFDFGNQAHTGLQPHQDLQLSCDEAIQVTLLMDPQARVHVTSGVLPKGYLELPAAQLKGAKQVREIFFQAAPVLGTPTTPHVPKPSDDYGQWSWAYRPNVTGWAEDPNMVSAAELAGPAVGWPTLTEGWLKLKIEPVLIRSLWMKAPARTPRKDTNITLAWSLHDADSAELFRLGPDGAEESIKKWDKLRRDDSEEADEKWIPPGPDGEWTIKVQSDTSFRIRASNRAGDEDYKDIEIQTQE